jgi:hypothetical protein
MRSQPQRRSILLPLSGGRIAERILRDHGGLRYVLARHIAGNLNKAYAAFLKDAWRPDVSAKTCSYPISLTSWRPRLKQLPLVLLMILQQSLRPSEIFVWLTDSDKDSIAEDVKGRFRKYGVRFEVCDDFRPHKKWLPMIERGRRAPFVICDDDIVYPRDWFASLISEDRPDAYVGTRCHRVLVMADGTVASYSLWEKQIRTEEKPSHFVFVTGGAGAVIHPDRIPKAFLDSNQVMQKCPNADDVWLKAAHLAANVPCYKTRWCFPCLELPGTNKAGLARLNTDSGGNDEQMRNLSEFFSLRLN